MSSTVTKPTITPAQAHLRGFGSEESPVVSLVNSSPTVAPKIIRVFLLKTQDEKDHLKEGLAELLSRPQPSHAHLFFAHEFSFGTIENSLIIQMPRFLKGNIIDHLKSLSTMLKDLKLVRIRLVKEVSDGLSFLHQHEITHGNIRGSNILITDDGHALLVDIGINTVILQAHEYKPLLSNLCWTAPELIDWDEDEVRIFPCTPKSDVYSLGRTVEEIYTLQDPFAHCVKAKCRMQLLIKLKFLTRYAPPTLPPCMPLAIWECFKDCCAVNPDDRPDSSSLNSQLPTM